MLEDDLEHEIEVFGEKRKEEERLAQAAKEREEDGCPCGCDSSDEDDICEYADYDDGMDDLMLDLDDESDVFSDDF